MCPPTPRIVWILIAVGAAARLMVAHWTQGLELILDEVNYLDYGTHLLAHGKLPGAFRPPAYPALIALAQVIGGAGPTSVRVAQSVISMGAAFTLFHWLQGHVGRVGALLSTALWCLHPVLIGFTHLLWTETLFLSLLIFFLATAMPSGTMTIRRTAAAGVLYGVAALTRSVLTPFVWLAPLFVAVLPSTWAFRQRPWFRAMVFWAAFGLTLAPWVAHNQEVEGRPIFTETTNGYNLWKGNTDWKHPFATEAPQYPGPLVSIPMFPYEGSGPRLSDHCEALHQGDETFTRWHLSQCARSMAIDHMVADPMGVLSRGVSKLGHAFHPSNLLTRHYWLGIYKGFPPVLAPMLIWATALSSLGILLLGILGLRRAPRTPLPLLLAGLGASQLAVIFITFGNTRFRLPVMLMAIIIAGWIPSKATHPD
jgi:hypothetical protein